MVSVINEPLLKKAQCSEGLDPTSLEHYPKYEAIDRLARAQISAAPVAQPSVRRADNWQMGNPLCPPDGLDPLN